MSAALYAIGIGMGLSRACLFWSDFELVDTPLILSWALSKSLTGQIQRSSCRSLESHPHPGTKPLARVEANPRGHDRLPHPCRRSCFPPRGPKRRTCQDEGMGDYCGSRRVKERAISAQRSALVFNACSEGLF